MGTPFHPAPPWPVPPRPARSRLTSTDGERRLSASTNGDRAGFLITGCQSFGGKENIAPRSSGLGCILEHCRRAPSAVLAEMIVTAYRLDPAEAAMLRAEAAEGVGQDSPFKRPSMGAGRSGAFLGVQRPHGMRSYAGERH
jgi:hypothetical protein